MWIRMPVFNHLMCLCSISSTCFCLVAWLFLWRCVAFVFCMPSSSDLLCSGLPQPENIVLTLQVKSAHCSYSEPHPLPHHAPLSRVTGAAQLQIQNDKLCVTFFLRFYNTFLYFIILSFQYIWDQLCGPKTLTQPPYPPYRHVASVACVSSEFWFRSASSEQQCDIYLTNDVCNTNVTVWNSPGLG